jgi:hypothetical protein
MREFTSEFKLLSSELAFWKLFATLCALPSSAWREAVEVGAFATSENAL